MDLELGYTPLNLKTLRNSKGLTQTQLANELDVSLSTIMKWEANITVKTHIDMPHAKWLEFLEKIKYEGNGW